MQNGPQPPPGAVRHQTEPEEAFREIFYRHYRLVLWHFRRRGVAPAEVEDLTQETFLAAFRGYSTFRGETRIDRWLLRIADNTLSKAIRSSHAQKRAGRVVSLDELPEAGPPLAPADPAAEASPLRLALAAEKLRLVSEALEDLPPQMRRCATLRLFQGLSYKEIAVVLQISLDTVRVQLFRARKRLAGRLGDHLGEIDV